MIGSLIDTVEGRISECNDSALEIIKIETEVKENEKKQNTYLRTEQELWDDVKYKCNCNPTMGRGMKQRKHLKE